MPYSLRKVKNRRCYSVKNLKKNITFSKCTSKLKAKKQIRLLRAIQYNKSFKPNLRRKQKKGGNTKKLLKKGGNKRENADKIKKNIEKTRPLHIREFEDWYEVIANQELHSQTHYLDYIDEYWSEHSIQNP